MNQIDITYDDKYNTDAVQMAELCADFQKTTTSCWGKKRHVT